MSVLIKDMAMPKSCCACPLFKSNMSKQLFCKAFGAFDKSDYDKLPIERMKNCPLVPVPPHGDLIDRDAAVEKIWDDMRFPSNLANAQFFVNELREMPTIIPADGKDIKVPTREEEV